MIELKKISKSYGDVQALKDVSLTIEKGELFGLLGPNGAGKTTIINIINTYLAFEKGELIINNLHIKQKESSAYSGINESKKIKIKKFLGIIPQEISLYDELTAIENLYFWGKMYGLKGEELDLKCTNMLKLVGLYKRRKKRIKTFSGGMKRRINIAAGLLHDPEILLMDEPTVGVDPQSRNFIYGIIEKLHKRGKTIIYTTHYMEEAERLCTRLAIIDKGKIIALGEKEELYKLLGDENSMLFIFKDTINIKNYNKKFANYSFKSISDNSFQLYGENLFKELGSIMKFLDSQTDEIEEVKIIMPNLESVFLKLTGRGLRE